MRIVHVLAAALAAALLAGCGGSAGEAVSLESVAQAATRTAEAGSSRVELRIAMEVGAESFEVEASGLFDYERQRGRMQMELPFFDGEMEFISDGTLLFFRLPEGMQGVPLPAGKRWLKLDLAQLGALASLDLEALMQMQQQQNPAQVLEYLKAAGEELERVGEEEVRGTATTRYRSSIDLRKALELQLETLPAEQQEKVRETAEEALEGLGDASAPVDIWVDAEGLVRRTVLQMTVPTGQAEPASASMRISMELYDFGVEVDVEHPPAAEVFDLAELIGKAGGG